MAGFGPETRGLKYPGLQNRGNPGTKGVIKSLKIVIFQCRKISICSTFYTQSCTERKKLIWRSVEPFYILFILKRLHKGYLKIMFLIFSTWHAELNANFISFLSRRIPCFFFKKTNKWEKFLPLVSLVLLPLLYCGTFIISCTIIKDSRVTTFCISEY